MKTRHLIVLFLAAILLSSILSSALTLFLERRFFPENQTVTTGVQATATALATAPAVDCGKELKRFCEDEESIDCLAKNYDLTPTACQPLADKRIRDGLPECKKEIEKFCANTPAGGGRLRRCLQNFKSDLSAKCNKRVFPKPPPPPPPDSH